MPFKTLQRISTGLSELCVRVRTKISVNLMGILLTIVFVSSCAFCMIGTTSSSSYLWKRWNYFYDYQCIYYTIRLENLWIKQSKSSWKWEGNLILACDIFYLLSLHQGPPKDSHMVLANRGLQLWKEKHLLLMLLEAIVRTVVEYTIVVKLNYWKRNKLKKM